MKVRRVLLLLSILTVMPSVASCNLLLRKGTTTKKSNKERQLGIGDSLVDARAMLQQKSSDNPISDLWDPDHLKVSKQTVDLNMNLPLNRLKLFLDSSYVVKVVAHNDKDYDQLYNYFHPEEAEDEG